MAETRRVPKPWGHELIWAHTERYVGKVLVIEAGKRLSLQHHEQKDEWIHVLSGRLRLTLANADGVVEERELGPGEGAHVPILRTHRYTAIETCTVIEVSTPELTDVVQELLLPVAQRDEARITEVMERYTKNLG